MVYKNKLIETIRYQVDAVTASPVSIKGDDDNLKIDSITGKFYIPGSSIAGAFRNYFEKYIKVNDTRKNVLFGDQELGMNRIVFYDAFTVDNSIRKMLLSRPGIRIDRRKLSGVYKFSMGKKVGSKFRRLFVNDGIRFLFVFELNNYDENCDFSLIQDQFEQLLSAFARGDILLGNNKTVGFGRFKINSVHRTAFNFMDYNDVIKYLLKETKKVEDITESILNRKSIPGNIRFVIKARTATPLLIKDEVVRSAGEPDGVNIKNGSDEYVLPGSSLKGALRSRAEKLAKTFPYIDWALVTNIFGAESDKEEDAHISRLICYDTIIKNSKTGLYNKIKIDYFTGGVQQHALMTEETVMGELDIECVFNTFGLKNYDKEIGILLLIFRDLCTENLNIGGGYAVGRGYIRAETLELLIDGRRIIYDFQSPDKKTEDKFNSYISKLTMR